jgi:hypothetical protein
MEKLIFCLQCQSLMNKTKPLVEDMLTVQKALVNQSQLFQNKEKMLLFKQWECKCGSNIIIVE